MTIYRCIILINSFAKLRSDYHKMEPAEQNTKCLVLSQKITFFCHLYKWWLLMAPNWNMRRVIILAYMSGKWRYCNPIWYFPALIFNHVHLTCRLWNVSQIRCSRDRELICLGNAAAAVSEDSQWNMRGNRNIVHSYQ